MGRNTKMNLKQLKLKNPNDVWKEYQTVGWMSIDSGYTTVTIRQWIKQGKIKGWLFNGSIVIRKDTKLPPSLLRKEK